MICPSCAREVSSPGDLCPDCGAPLSVEGDETLAFENDADSGQSEDTAGMQPEFDMTVELDATLIDSGEHTIDVPSAGAPVGSVLSDDDAILKVGEAFGSRYRIDKLLGFGGMGAVYKAWDNELDIAVALKVIRPEVAADPALAEQLDRRFKRELLLARQVTHKNVVRIHDLGNIEGVKYITMTFIEGEDLLALLKREGTVPVREALRILRPVVSGLHAAHEAGVVHRDLKPANLMIEESTGESYIMDFGIASSATPTGVDVVEGLVDAKSRKRAGVTEESQAGAVVGTLQYMPPEQFMGRSVDQRADIYAFGLIFYDLLVGRRRIEKAESAFSEFRGRVEQAPPTVRSIDPEIPEDVDRIISRCLDPDPEARYQTSHDLEADLDRLDEDGIPLPITRLLTRRLVVASTALVVVLLGGTWWLASLRGPAVEPDPFSVLVADFSNQTGDSSFDGALEQALAIGMEGASFISAMPPANAHQIAEQIQPGTALDENMARLVSRREGVSVILVGEISSDGDRYALSVLALDPGLEPGEGKPLASARATAANKDTVLAAVGKIAAELRGELGDTTPKSDRLAAAETFTAASLEAMSAYARGQDLAVQGEFEDALVAYQEAVASDPEFGRAYAGMGVVYGNLRREDAAEESYQKAFKNLDRMSERERTLRMGVRTPISATPTTWCATSTKRSRRAGARWSSIPAT